MEALLILIAEWLVPLFVGLVTFIVEFIVAVISLIGHVLTGLFGRKKSPKTMTWPGGQPSLTFLSRSVLVVGTVSGGLLVAGLFAIILVNLFFLTPTVTWLAGKITERSGIEIAFDKASGNLLTGRLSVSGLRVKHSSPDKTDYAFATKSVDVDVDVLSLVGDKPTVSTLGIDGVSGEIRTKPRRDKDREPPKRKKRRRAFEIAALDISDASIQLHKTGSPPVTLTVDNLKSAPLRSDLAVFDLFFRSNIDGDINGHKIEITTSRKDGGRTTKWRLYDFPAAFVGHFTDQAPFNWFEQGTIDVSVDDDWSLADSAQIDMSWRVVLKGVKVVEPDNSNIVERAVATPIARFINSRDRDVVLPFRLVMNQEQFRAKPTLDAAGLWKAVLAGTARAIADKYDTTVDEAQDKIKKSLDKLKGFLDKKRKKRAD